MASNDVGGTVKYVITADTSDFIKGINEASKKLEEFGKNKEVNKTGEELGSSMSHGASQAANALSTLAKTAVQELGSISRAIGNISFNTLTTGAAAAATSFAALAQQGISDTQFLEQQQIGMVAFTGSVEEGNKALNQAADFFKNNPFQRFDVTSAVKNLIQFGATTDQIPGKLEKLGNVSLATGVNISELGYYLQRSLSDGVVHLEDLEIMADRGVPIWNAFEKALGLTSAQVRELSADSKLTGEQLETAFNWIADNSQEAADMFEKTLSRQVDRFKGRIADLRAAIAGYSFDVKNGLVIENEGLYRSVTRLTKVFADYFTVQEDGTMRGQKFVDSLGKLGNAVAKLIDQFADKLPSVLDKVGSALEFLGDHAELVVPIIGAAAVAFGQLASGLPGIGGVIGNLSDGVMSLGNAFMKASLPTKAFVALLGAGLFKALQDGSLNEPLQSIVSSLGKIASALAPVIQQLASIVATIGSAVLVPTITALSKALELFADVISKIPTGVLTALTTALIGFVAVKKTLPVLDKFFGVMGGSAAKAAAKTGSALGKGLGSAIVGLFSALGKNLAAVTQGSLALGAIGLAIGVFIGSVGGGIWIFGEAMQAVGDGLKNISDGAEAFAKADVDGLAANMNAFVGAMSGMLMHVGDLASAALTFPAIGDGLADITVGLNMLNAVKLDSITKKLPALGEALKSFQIGFFDSIFSGNIVSKFKDSADAIVAIGDLINLIADMKIDGKKLRKSMSDLAEGLKAFLIPEIQPSWIQSVFGGGTINTQSVTDKMKSLGDIVEPMNGLVDMFQGMAIDSDELQEDLAGLAEGLKAFLIPELQPSWIQSVFGSGTVDFSSVTDYLGSLGNIIDPLNKLAALLQSFSGNVSADSFTDFVKNLGDSLKAFIVTDLDYTFKGFLTFSETLKTETKSILEGFDNFTILVEGINNLAPLFSEGAKFDSGKFTEFMTSLGEALQAFTVKDIDKTISLFLTSSEHVKTETKNILEGISNLGTLVKGINDLAPLFSEGSKFDSGKFNSFMEDLASTLSLFSRQNTELTTESWGSSSTSKTTYDNILQHLGDFGSFASGVSQLVEIASGEKFDPDKFDKMMTSIRDTLERFSVTNTTITNNDWGFEDTEKREYDNILAHLGDFKGFAEGISSLLNTLANQAIDDSVVERFKNVMSNIVDALNSTTEIFTSSKSASGGYGLISMMQTNTMSSAFEHLGDFKSTMDGIVNLINAVANTQLNVGAFMLVMSSIASCLKSVTSIFTSEESASGFWGLISSNVKNQMDSAFDHMQYFESFANGVKTIIEAINGMQISPIRFQFVLATLTSCIRSTVTIFTSESEDKTLGGLLGSSSTKNQMDSAWDHMQHFESFANGIQTLVNTIAQKDFDIDGFTDALDKIFKALNTLMLKETELTSKDGDSASVSYDTILNHMDQFKTMVDSLQVMVNQIGVGGGFDAAAFSAQMTAITTAIKSTLGALQGISYENINLETLNGVITAITNLKNGTAGWDTSLLPTQGANIASFINGVLGSLTGTNAVLMTVALTAFNSFLDNLKNSAANFANDMYTKGTEIVNKFGEGLSQGYDKIQATIEQKIRSMLTTATDNLTDHSYNRGYHIGYWMSEGLKSALNDAQGKVSAAAAVLANMASDAMQKAAQVNSPSKITLWIGSMMGEGLAEGLIDQTRLVEKAAQQLANTVQNPFDEINGISVGVAGDIEHSNGVGYNKSTTINQNNYINNGLDYSAMMADLKWSISRA